MGSARKFHKFLHPFYRNVVCYIVGVRYNNEKFLCK
jgi:hypothetical protein